MNKLKTILSGSSQAKEKNPKDKPDNEDMVNNFMNQILDSAWIEEDLKATCAPSYFLSKKNKSYWLMNTTVKSLFNIKGGIEIIPIETGDPNTLCLIGHSTYSIPNKYIVCPGWN
jgi:hypothetical protein